MLAFSFSPRLNGHNLLLFDLKPLNWYVKVLCYSPLPYLYDLAQTDFHNGKGSSETSNFARMRTTSCSESMGMRFQTIISTTYPPTISSTTTRVL